MVRGAGDVVTRVPCASQCAEMQSTAVGFAGSSAACLLSARVKSLSAMAFIGEPWPTNQVGMMKLESK